MMEPVVSPAYDSEADAAVTTDRRGVIREDDEGNSGSLHLVEGVFGQRAYEGCAHAAASLIFAHDDVPEPHCVTQRP